MNPPNITTGTHLLIAITEQSGDGKSTFVAEARTAAHVEGVPTRLITFDPHGSTLNRALRGEVIHCLSNPHGDLLLESFGEHIEAARTSGEIVIADTPPGIIDGDNPLLRAFAESRILDAFDSVGLLIPITAWDFSIIGAFETLRALERLRLNFDRGLIRAWHHDPGDPAWDSFRLFTALAMEFPVWKCEHWHRVVGEMVNGHGNYAKLPPLHLLCDHLVEHGASMNTRDRGSLRSAVAHLEDAREAIRTHLLAPILECGGSKSKTTSP